VDNASTPRIDTLCDLSWHPRARTVREEQLGLTAARLKAIRETDTSLIVFVDDDNLLAPDYLERAVELARCYPYLGVFGAGVLAPEFEKRPAPECEPLLRLLALRTVPASRWSNHIDDTDCLPWGAGLCVRRKVARRFADLVHRVNALMILGRRGQVLTCGEDDVFSWASSLAGLGFGVFPDLRVTHLIPSVRVTRPYFLRLIQAHSFSHGILRYLLAGIPPPAGGIPSMARLLLRGAYHGAFSLRCGLASARGAAEASAFIGTNSLRPLDVSRDEPPPDPSSGCGATEG
jgi:hypothetical protein